jgi:multiple sugar transport system substrate-binding protein
MKRDIYKALVARSAMSRRGMLKGAAAMGGLAAFGGFSPALAQDESVRAQILKIPGVGAGSPTEADHIKVGELCLGPTKATVQPGEFAGVELTFFGPITSGVFNVLFRGFLKPWEDYTGAKITWIDVVQTDFNPRLMQSIASGTMEWDVMAMGALLEGDVMSKGMLDEMPQWVAPIPSIAR